MGKHSVDVRIGRYSNTLPSTKICAEWAIRDVILRNICGMGGAGRGPPTGAKHWPFNRFPKAEKNERESEVWTSILMKYLTSSH